MRKNMHKFSLNLAAGVLVLAAAGSALADDTELFVGNAGAQPDARPNILFIIDNSGSMSTRVDTREPYDPATVYSGSCDPSRILWQSGSGNPPSCSSNRWITPAALKCITAVDTLATAGYYTDRMAQLTTVRGRHGRPDTEQWRPIDRRQRSLPVECQADRGVHGENAGDAAVWAADGTTGWSSNPADEVSWSARNTRTSYTLYDANYLNWYYSVAAIQQTRLDIVKQATNSLVATMNNVNVGLMQFNDSQGGPVVYPVTNISTDRAQFMAKVNAIPFNGWTPLSETMYEAGQYYKGNAVHYGNVGPTLSVAGSRTGNTLASDTYATPITYECQKNFVVLLTDGEPTQDVDANARITGLPGFQAATGSATCDGSGDGKCLDDMTKYMFQSDMSPSLDGVQNVSTYTIGFTVDLPLLESTAHKGGGQYYLANDTATLSVVLTNIVRQILDIDTSFVAPTVSVNAFNRTQTRDDLYVAVFKPRDTERWPGNIKKYRLVNGQIVGTDLTTPVVDPATGFIKDSGQSFWSAAPDGPNVTEGGAASQMPAPGVRKVMTYLGDPDLAAAGNRVIETNSALGAYVMTLPGYEGLNSNGSFTCDSNHNPDDGSQACDIIKHAYGVDIKDENQNDDYTDNRKWMGDPLHSKPEMVTYGGTVANPDPEDNVLYSASNDGYLHAIDPVTGVEKWAFIPAEMLPLLPELYQNDIVPDQTYGIDGNIRTVVVDLNHDGIVDPAAGERVYLYFGLRRGGNTYYGLDVTYKDSPRLMWVDDASSLPGLGETWSTPTAARVVIAGAAQNTLKLTLIFGAGHDPREDNGPYAADSQGNGILMIDALSGALLWRAGEDATANLQLADMTNSIVGDIRVLDMTGDGLSDRLYAADLGGRVWRFDLTNGAAVNSLAAGGVIATLGGAYDPTTPEANRRFYYAPDVALVTTRYSRFLHVGIGSGYRAHPVETATQDRFYSVRDYNPFRKLTQTEYNNLTPLTDADLQDVTDNVSPNLAPDAAGWKIELRQSGWIGEKVLSESRTFADTVYFTSFTPGANVNPCQPGQGLNKLYAVSVVDGSPVNNLDGAGSDQTLTVTDRVQSLAQGGIAPEIVFLFPDPSSCTSGDCQTVYGFVGLEGIGNLNLPPFVRTYWEQAGSQ